MFIGRQRELSILERMYASDKFEMMVLYGRRRIGKTSLIDEFVAAKEVLYFTALQQAALANLRDFSNAVYEFFGYPTTMPSFVDWKTAFSFVAQEAINQSKKFVFVFDEFPYAAEVSKELASALQIVIDHEFLKTDITLILSGSNEGFMESKVLGTKSPLYGRRTGQLRLQPFDFIDAAKFVPQASVEEVFQYYAVFGGTPYYLAQIQQNLSFQENVKNLLYDNAGLLFEEPMMLLRQELREPAVYNSILREVALGNTTLQTISQQIGVEARSLSKYMKVLEELKIISRIVPVGSNIIKTRKGMYVVADPFFAYWYRFIAKNVGRIESGLGEQVADSQAFGEVFSTYVGQQFETMSQQWLIRQSQAGEVPIFFDTIGKWWGTNPAKREQTDIDIVLLNSEEKTAVLCECKWRNTLQVSQVIQSLQDRAALISGYRTVGYMLFTKESVSEKNKQTHPNVQFISAQDMIQA